jgi:hypothetical protein
MIVLKRFSVGFAAGGNQKEDLWESLRKALET